MVKTWTVRFEDCIGEHHTYLVGAASAEEAFKAVSKGFCYPWRHPITLIDASVFIS